MARKTYDVTFYRTLTNSQGKQHKTPLSTVRVLTADEERAARLAARAFQRRRNLRSWQHLADGYELRAG